jgi:hypothetical protein
MRLSVATVEPTFTVADVQRRHDTRVRRLTAMCLAVGLAMAVLGYFLPKQLGRVDAASLTVEPLAGHTTSYTDPSYGWSISYNSALVERRSAFGSQPDLVESVRFTNFTPKMGIIVSATSAASGSNPRQSWLREFPASGVALEVWTDASTQTRPPAHDTAFPLQVAKFAPVHKFAGGSEPTPLYQKFYGDGLAFRAAVWIGRLATIASTRAIWAAVRSVRFPPLRSGTIWQDRFYVLDQARRYPVDSVTLFPSASLPRGSLSRVGFYLVHSPREFYVVQLSMLVAGSHMLYLVRYDARRRQFFSPGTGLRWSRVGNPVVPVAAPVLQITPATVSQDGHVLYAPDLGDYQPGPPQVESVS